MNRRDFMGSALGAAAMVSAQGISSGADATTAGVPTRTARVTKLFKSPDLHPNDLEAADEGLWIGDQVSEKLCLVDWKTGKKLREIQTEAHNTTGIAFGAGYLWVLATEVSVTGGPLARPTSSMVKCCRPTQKPARPSNCTRYLGTMASME